MTKHDFVRVVAKETGYTIPVTEKVIDATFNCIVDLLADGESVSIAHFGKFDTKTVAAKEIKSPWTDGPVLIEAHNKPRFKFFDSVKEAI